MFWNCGSYKFDTRMSTIMGILNVTPDSFSDGGLYTDVEAAVRHAKEMIENGAAIIDVGGESTRPGSAPVSIQEELSRTVDVVRRLAKDGICVSIDTRHAHVARACLEAGASIVNDISGFSDPNMVEAVRDFNCGLVVMHMQGTPETMQNNPTYTDVVSEVYEYLHQQAHMLEAYGIARERICIDPGPGFGKTFEQTTELVRNMQVFARMGYPVMCAISRKSFLGNLYGIEDPIDRDVVSAEEALQACELGATIIRCHNVALTREKLQHMRPLVFLGLGANVALVANDGEETEGKIANLNYAITELCSLPDSQIVDISSFYESEPAYKEDQDTFVNAVVALRSGIPPKELLSYLHAIENSLGRVRLEENGPRTCDIDILDYQLYTADTKELTLPHPLLLERDFVVQPFMELRPRYTLANGTELTSAQVCVGKAHKLTSRGE